MKLYYVEGSEGVKFFSYTTTASERARIKLYLNSKVMMHSPFVEDEGEFSTVDHPGFTMRIAAMVTKAINGPIRFPARH